MKLFLDSTYFLHNLILLGMGNFGAAHGWVGKEARPSLKFVTYLLQWWNLAQLHLTYRRCKKCMNPVTHTLSSANNCLVEHRRNYYITYNNILYYYITYNNIPVELLNIFFNILRHLKNTLNFLIRQNKDNFFSCHALWGYFLNFFHG